MHRIEWKSHLRWPLDQMSRSTNEKIISSVHQKQVLFGYIYRGPLFFNLWTLVVSYCLWSPGMSSMWVHCERANSQQRLSQDCSMKYIYNVKEWGTHQLWWSLSDCTSKSQRETTADRHCPYHRRHSPLWQLESDSVGTFRSLWRPLSSSFLCIRHLVSMFQSRGYEQ